MKILVAIASVALCGAAMQTPPRIVSVYSLLANPADHSGFRVSTVGYLNLAEMMVCVDKSSAQKPVFPNCIPLGGVARISDEMKNDYVQIIGFFDASDPTPRGHVGAIRNVELIRPYRP